MYYEDAKHIADGLVELLAPSCARIEIAGGVRRKKESPHDIEIVCIPSPGNPRPEFGDKRTYRTYLDKALVFLEDDRVLPLKVKGGDKYKQYHINTDRFGVKLFIPFALDLFIVRPETWGVLFTIRTGPHTFSRQIVTPKSLGGLLPDGYKVKDGRVWHADDPLDTPIDLPEEQDFFDFLGIPWIAPEKRQ